MLATFIPKIHGQSDLKLTDNILLDIQPYSIIILCMLALNLFSPPEPSGSQDELKVYTCSLYRLLTIFKVFSSETAGPIKAKFHVEPLRAGGTKVFINVPGHTQDSHHAHILYMVENLKKSSPEPGPMILKLCKQHQGLKLYRKRVNSACFQLGPGSTRPCQLGLLLVNKRRYCVSSLHVRICAIYVSRL